MMLYHGTGGATIALDAGGALPVLATHLELHGVTVQPLFRDIAGIDQVIGTGDISLDLQGHGANPREIVSSLSGAVSISLGAGTFSGTGFTDLMRSVAGRFAGKKIKAIEFASLAATGTIADGVLHNSDLKLASTKMSATGEGTVDLQKRQIDYLAVLSMAETTARIIITGPWTIRATRPSQLRGAGNAARCSTSSNRLKWGADGGPVGHRLVEPTFVQSDVGGHAAAGGCPW
jgi:uncharacterized protein involved in outer membrane biogenesis